MTQDPLLKATTPSWMEAPSEDDIVISTRIRLARNITNYRFPRLQTEEEATLIQQKVTSLLASQQYRALPMDELSALERLVLVEKHMISPLLAKRKKGASLLIRQDEQVSVMVNEEDHLRIQSLCPGLQLQQAYDAANELDSQLEQQLEYAYDEKLGYLTTCPTNLGTGLRASVMLHLPALTLTNQMKQLIQTMPRLGMVVRGIYGEGSENLGNMYQVSNQITLGKSEADILEDLQAVAEKIILREQQAREQLVERAALTLEDRIFRSLGTLRYARTLTSEEAATCLSNVRLGINLGYIHDVSIATINQCMMLIQRGLLQQHTDATLQPEKRDLVRATLLREQLTESHTEEHNNGEKGEDIV
ncbi:protein arginine kinase [Caryophanon tenue]|uniref:Protein-arginine kinase n=1 Tax=Caryophanon tenue TaxID=33978 RepID=A0A1C0YLD8_9BACL|nr:protein arginine kinase [Caryophanon tenue]OCS87968.1 protein arginine kinase [Caryophanon tenue]